jgi:hypothetical protein
MPLKLTISPVVRSSAAMPYSPGFSAAMAASRCSSDGAAGTSAQAGCATKAAGRQAKQRTASEHLRGRLLLHPRPIPPRSLRSTHPCSAKSRRSNSATRSKPAFRGGRGLFFLAAFVDMAVASSQPPGAGMSCSTARTPSSCLTSRVAPFPVRRRRLRLERHRARRSDRVRPDPPLHPHHQVRLSVRPLPRRLRRRCAGDGKPFPWAPGSAR